MQLGAVHDHYSDVSFYIESVSTHSRIDTRLAVARVSRVTVRVRVRVRVRVS